ncbi:hypothetical protein U5817_06680 [Aromatoleum evansii]|uniref:Uncharacterized protein n=1 Tax=Aromatoleum evansii TaxID=59406 RepID=A0ABZ1APD6_AROEV|nr:hypothetical protein U5817_06680 [Aromatoleum evansii]
MSKVPSKPTAARDTQTKLTRELQARIRAERRALGLKPHEWAPSETGERNPYPPGCPGYAMWEKARRLRDKLRQRAESRES